MKSHFLKVIGIGLILIYFSCTSDEGEVIQENNLNNLEFNQVYEFNSNLLEGPIFGMTSSLAENSLFISSRDDFPLIAGENREQITKLNLNNNTVSEKIYANSDFITKRLFIKDNRLICVGGSFVNSYDLDLVNDPITVSHGKYLSHFNMAESDQDMYIIGGELLNGVSNKIYKWDYNNPQEFNEFASIPEDRYGADGVVINQNLYVFGGSTNSILDNASDKIYVIPLDNSSNVQELTMNVSSQITFAQKYQNVIIVAGRVRSIDSQGNSMADTFMGIFDPATENFSEIPFNLENPNGQYAIGQMQILNDKLYILYGYFQNNYPAANSSSEWAIYSANLN